MDNKDHSNKNSLIKGISSQTLITIIIGLLNVVSFAFFSRLLSKESFGYFAALNAIIMVFQGISEAGLGSAVIQKKDYTKQYFSTAFTLSLIVSFSLALILFIFATPIALLVSDETLIKPIRIICVLLITNSISSVGWAIMMRKLKFFRYGMIQVVSYILSYGIGIYLAFKGYGLYSLVISAVLNSVLTCLFVFSFEVRIPRLYIERSDCRQIVSFGGWLTASVMVNQLTFQLDKLVLSKWLSVIELGAYSRPSGFIGTISDRFNGIFDTVLFPILSKIQDDAERIKQSFLDAISLLNSFSAVLAAVFFFNAELIIQIFFGNEWLDITYVFRIISLGVVLMVDARLMDCFFRSLALVRLNFILRLICMFIMLGALFIGSRHGIVGVAYGVVIANTISIIIKMTVLCNHINVPLIKVLHEFLSSLKPVILLCVLGVVYILFVDKTIICNVAFAILFAIVTGVEFILCPKMVSTKYALFIEPYLKKFRK